MSTHHDPFRSLRSTASIGSRARRLLGAAAALFATSSAGWAFQITYTGGGTISTSAKGASGQLIVPEIDPALTGGMIALLVGGVLILTSRRRRAPAS